MHRADVGSISLEAMLEFLLMLLIAPVVLSCAMQVLLALVGLVVPWLALIAIAAIMVGALAAAAAAQPRTPGPPADSRVELPPPPPVRRPSGDQGMRH